MKHELTWEWQAIQGLPWEVARRLTELGRMGVLVENAHGQPMTTQPGVSGNQVTVFALVDVGVNVMHITTTPQTIEIFRIKDTPGYDWEIVWTDPDGEGWSEEAATDEDLVERVREILEGWREQL